MKRLQGLLDDVVTWTRVIDIQLWEYFAYSCRQEYGRQLIGLGIIVTPQVAAVYGLFRTQPFLVWQLGDCFRLLRQTTFNGCAFSL